MRTYLPFAVISAAALIVVADANADPGPITTATGPTVQFVPLTLACENPGSAQADHKRPRLRNTSNWDLPNGAKVSWRSSDGDSGVVTLNGGLKRGWAVEAIGKPGKSYKCSATTPSDFTYKPDLVINSVTLAAGGVDVQVGNLGRVNAGPSILRVLLTSCSGGAATASVDTTIEVPANSTKTIHVNTPAVPNPGTVIAQADAAKVLTEIDEYNNNGSSTTCPPDVPR